MATEPPPDAAPEGGWPLISVVTPSFNQAEFLEETLRSILLQGYPAVELIVMDGGSTDGSVEIIRRYERWLAHWQSARDRGQTDAINQGIARATGEVFNWLNSDDTLTPGALFEVGRAWRSRAPHLLIGAARTVEYGTGAEVRSWLPRAPRRPIDLVRPGGTVIPQPSSWVDMRTLRELGPLREDLHCVMDWELYLRLSLHLRSRLRVVESSMVLAQALDHPATKTNLLSAKFQQEAERLLLESWSRWSLPERLQIRMHIRRKRAQELMGDALTPRAGALARVFSLGLRFPDALVTRFFWGGVRRALQPHGK